MELCSGILKKNIRNPRKGHRGKVGLGWILSGSRKEKEKKQHTPTYILSDVVTFFCAER